MGLKEIKPGMVIHCKTKEEKIGLLEEADKLGYKWNNHCVPTDCRMIGGTGMTIHFHEKSECTDFKHITWSDNTEKVTEFSDLIIPDMSEEEVLQIFGHICATSSCSTDCPFRKLQEEYSCPEFLEKCYKKVVEICQQWKSDHEKKEPEVEWHFYAEVHRNGFDSTKNCGSEEEAIQFVEEELKKAGKDAYGEYKRICRVKAVE